MLSRSPIRAGTRLTRLIHPGALIATVALVVIAHASAVTPDRGPAALAAFWSDRERQAQLPEDRARLALDLLHVAADPGLPADDRRWLLERSYHWGSRDRPGFGTAARALEAIQALDPARRLECVERLVPLYEAAYAAAPTRNLGLGVGLVNTRLTAAGVIQQELLRADGDPQPDRRPTAEKRLPRLSAAETHLVKARTVALNILSALQAHFRQARQSANPDNLRALEAFLEPIRTMPEDIAERLTRLQQEQTAWRWVVTAEAALARDPANADAARRLALLHLTELDNPAGALPYATLGLGPTERDLLQQAVRDPARLPIADADRLARWYDSLAAEARPLRRSVLLARAEQYRQRATTTPEASPASTTPNTPTAPTPTAPDPVASSNAPPADPSADPPSPTPAPSDRPLAESKPQPASPPIADRRRPIRDDDDLPPWAKRKSIFDFD